jgi:hypothetical protein
MSEDELTVILASMKKVLADLIEERIALPEKIRDAKATGDTCQLTKLIVRDELLPRLIAEVDWNTTRLSATLDRVRSDGNLSHSLRRDGGCRRDGDRLEDLGSAADGHPWHGHSQSLGPELAQGSAATTP